MKLRTSNTAACRIRWSHDGPCWQTRRAYPKDQALRLARMFAANPRNSRAMVTRQGRDWAIRIWPASLTGIYQRVMAAMLDRVRAEGAGFRYTARADGSFDCLNPKTGGQYIVSHEGCTCPQAPRAAKVGLPCKHSFQARAIGLFPLAGELERAA